MKENNDTAQRRILEIYDQLIHGHSINKEQIIAKYAIDKRTVQRDMRIIRSMVADNDVEGYHSRTVKLDRKTSEYRIEPPMRNLLDESEAFAVLKMILECRGFNKKELKNIIEKLVDCGVAGSKKLYFMSMLNRESATYVGPQHNRDVIKTVWKLQEAIQNKDILKLQYIRSDKTLKKYKVIPVGLVYNEFYFYLIAYVKDGDIKKNLDRFPTTYRIDRIDDYKVTKDKYTDYDVPHDKQFTEGEFRKRVQFMLGGELRRYTLSVKNASVEAVIDRLPSAIVRKNMKPDEADRTVIEVEIYGPGFDMWVKGQGDNVRVLKDVKALGKL